MAGLFTQGLRAPCFDGDAIYGIGSLLKSLAEEVSILEDILNSGYDSMADTRNGVDEENNEVEDSEEESHPDS